MQPSKAKPETSFSIQDINNIARNTRKLFLPSLNFSLMAKTLTKSCWRILKFPWKLVLKLFIPPPQIIRPPISRCTLRLGAISSYFSFCFFHAIERLHFLSLSFWCHCGSFKMRNYGNGKNSLRWKISSVVPDLKWSLHKQALLINNDFLSFTFFPGSSFCVILQSYGGLRMSLHSF